MGSVFGNLEQELVCERDVFATRAEAERAPFDSVELFYNRMRRHSAVGYVGPAEHEQTFFRRKAA